MLCAQIMELDQKLQETTRQLSRLQASDAELQERLAQDSHAREVRCSAPSGPFF